MLDYSQEEKEFFMSEALKEAQKSLDKAEIPIGCVIVKDRKSLVVGIMRVRNSTKLLCMRRSWPFKRPIGQWATGVC